MKRVATSTGEYRAATVLPGDPEHDATAALLRAAGISEEIGREMRHRTYVWLPDPPPVGKEDKSEEWRKKQPLGLTVMGEFSFLPVLCLLFSPLAQLLIVFYSIRYRRTQERSGAIVRIRMGQYERRRCWRRSGGERR